MERTTRIALVACAVCFSGAVPAQAPQYPAPAPAYPQPAYPQPAYAAPGFDPNAPRPSRMKNFFAATLSTVLTATGTNSVVGLSDALAGGLSEWFDRRRAKKQARAQAQAGEAPQGFPAAPAATAAAPLPAYTPLPDAAAGVASAYPPQPVADPGGYATATAPAYPPVDASAGAAYPAAFAPVDAAYAPVQFFDPQTGAPAAPPADTFGYSAEAAAPSAVSPSAATLPAEPQIFAGLAYEVHTLSPNGLTQPVDPARHEFHSGDMFVVMYRTTLPGRMQVFNINPAGMQTQIDSVDVAAGQLVRLGPYRFEAMTGDESLRFVLSPCSSPALFTATRDITKVDAPLTGGLDLGNCDAARTRSIRGPVTRDIRKVAVEGTTAFAFDPVSPQEIASGAVAARELTIQFRHR